MATRRTWRDCLNAEGVPLDEIDATQARARQIDADDAFQAALARERPRTGVIHSPGTDNPRPVPRPAKPGIQQSNMGWA